MTLAACAELVRKGDPDRFLAAMAAPGAARAVLFPLYAFNVEVARAPWVTAEPLIAEMRLQWWRDALAEIAAGARPRAHEVAAPLAKVMARGVPAELLDRLVVARRWDIGRLPFADADALFDYLERTGAGLAWAAALALGAPPEAEAPVRAVGRAGALAAWFRAVPALEAAGRLPLPETDLGALAGQGLAWLAEGHRHVPKAARPALYPAWQARAILTRAVRDPDAVRSGRLGLSEFSRRFGLVRLALTGRS